MADYKALCKLPRDSNSNHLKHCDYIARFFMLICKFTVNRIHF
ncbi:hypothetical protein PLG01_01192 [Streptococcus mutans PKUSS-LG01]|nr:hypothetical protein PLG01_01192 [Streptococcus mutans PKUSS-LG01]